MKKSRNLQKILNLPKLNRKPSKYIQLYILLMLYLRSEFPLALLTLTKLTIQLPK